MTAILVGAAVFTFAIVVKLAESPVSTFRRIAVGVPLISFVPNIVVALVVAAADWPFNDRADVVPRRRMGRDDNDADAADCHVTEVQNVAT